MLPIQPWAGDRAQKELAAIGVRPCICHAEDAWHIMLQHKVLVCKAWPINALA